MVLYLSSQREPLKSKKVNIAGWSSLVARRAHNPKVVGSNPAPATNTINTLTGVFLFLAFVKPRSKQEKKMAPFGAILLSPSRQRRAIREVGFNPCPHCMIIRKKVYFYSFIA